MLEIPGYEDGALTEGSAYLAHPMFWPVHFGTSLRGAAAQQAAFGADWDAAMELYRVLSSGHTIHVVYRNIEGDHGVDYLIHHPEWSAAETLAVEVAVRRPSADHRRH